MIKKRPINLDLTSLSYPPMAIASILHRISGIILFLFMPVMLYLLAQSLKSSDSFAQTGILLSSIGWKLVIWSFSAALIYHILAGFRHIMMDMGFGEKLQSGKNGAIIVIVLSIILTILMGIWLW